MQNIQKLNMRGPWTSNVIVKFIASPFTMFINAEYGVDTFFPILHVHASNQTHSHSSHT